MHQVVFDYVICGYMLGVADNCKGATSTSQLLGIHHSHSHNPIYHSLGSLAYQIVKTCLHHVFRVSVIQG